MNEGLRAGDLDNLIYPMFTVDQYQSKMGNDKDVMVLRFRAKGKEPAIDLMEFIEKGFEFILDADMSSGEEKDGEYSVFVELERDADAPKNIKSLLDAVQKLCGCTTWKFRWYKDSTGHEFDIESFAEFVPCSAEDYDSMLDQSTSDEVSEFFDQGAIDDITVEGQNITFTKPYAEPLKARLIALGEYDVLKHVLQGGLQLDESSRNQVMYLNKFLGNYDINKIENHFLIRNGKKAVILSKNTW